MILNIYVYKGSLNSLIGPWVVIGFIADPLLKYENIIPSIKNIYTNRKSLSKYNYIIRNNIYIDYIFSDTINTYSEYSIIKSVSKIIRWAKLIYPTFTINNIDKPFYWYERLTIITAVFYRNIYLSKISTYHDLVMLDKNYKTHLEVLCSYLYLPPLYIWSKSIEAVKFIQPKPYWYNKELKEYYEYYK